MPETPVVPEAPLPRFRRVLVTGGAGFIGSNLVDALLGDDIARTVVVIDDLSEGRRSNLSRWLDDPRLTLMTEDIRRTEAIRWAAAGCDVCFHLAGMSRIQPSITDPREALSRNVIGTMEVLEACRAGGVGRVVLSASSSAYGLTNGLPNREDMVPDCLNPYSLSKKVSEELGVLWTRLYGMSVVSLRYFNVYGPRHQEEGSYATVIAIFRRQSREGRPMTIVGDGEQRRDFTYVSDVVRANLLLAGRPWLVGTFNVGSGRNRSVNEVAALVGGPTVNVPPRLGEARLTLADVSRLRKETGWAPSIDLPEGLARLDAFEGLTPDDEDCYDLANH